MLKKNQEIAITIDSCTALGSGVGKYDGMAVFVANTAPGEHVIAHIIKAKPKYAIGKLVKVIHKSPVRITPECPVFQKCGGCAFGHIDYDAEAEIKAQQIKDNFSHIGGIEIEPEPIIKSLSEKRYRNKAQFPVRTDEYGLAQIGFFAPHSHRVVDCSDCLLQPDEFRKITDIFRTWIRLFKIKAYDEITHKGILRHIYIRKAVETGEIMVCAVINGSSLPFSDELVFELREAVQEISSIILNKNTEDTNVVLGQDFEVLYGKGYITDSLCGLSFDISPLAFYQVNHDTAQLLYGKAKEYASLTGEETLLDLYCGTGTIGLTMADSVKEVIGVEIIPQAVENAIKNAEKNNIKNARFICADAPKAAEILSEEGLKPEVIIVDPPRKGCDEELIKTIGTMSPDRIVYVSCDSATLARDCKRLLDYGYTVTRVTPVDMFPRTPHVETVCLLINQNASAKHHVNVEIDAEDYYRIKEGK